MSISKKTETAWTYLLIVLAAALMAVSYEIFIFNNEFAPAGLNGIATMIQKLFGFSVGYMSLIINVPLCLAVSFMGDYKLGSRTLVFTAVFSACLLLFKNGVIDLSPIAYRTENGTSTILAPIAAGVVSGAVYGVLFRRSASTGGTDLIAAIIRRRHPEINMVWLIFGLNSAVAAISFFVYGYQFEPVIMCVVYCFITSRIGDMILSGVKRQMKFEIVTDSAKEMSEEIIEKLHHTATMIHAKGMYSGTEKDMLICVVQRHQIIKLRDIIEKYPGSFAYVSAVNEIFGNFRRIPRNGFFVPKEKRPGSAASPKTASAGTRNVEKNTNL